MREKHSILIVLLFVGCIIGSQGVYFEEMGWQPKVAVNNKTLTVKTTNSFKNSALSIYCIGISVNHSQKIIYISAEQAVVKEAKNIFTLELDKYNIDDISSYKLYWLDPDKKTTKLFVSKM